MEIRRDETTAAKKEEVERSEKGLTWLYLQQSTLPGTWIWDGRLELSPLRHELLATGPVLAWEGGDLE